MACVSRGCAAIEPPMSGRPHHDRMDRMRSTPAQLAGDDAEDEVCARLVAGGWEVLARNLRLGRSEVDVLAVDPGPPRELVVLEVRRRARRDFGLAEETLGHAKRRAMRRAVGLLLERGALPDGRSLPRLPLRVDLVAMDTDAGGRRSVRHHRGIRLGGGG